MGVQRSNGFTFEFYPDSQSYDFVYSSLCSLIVPFVISPLHDADVKADGTLKKPHYHVSVIFDSLKSLPQVSPLLCPLAANGYVEHIKNNRSCIRYITHIDYPSKAQYSLSDAVACGIDLKKYFDDDANRSYLKEILTFCSDNCIADLHTLTEYAISDKPDWLSTIVKSAYFFNIYLKGNRVK